MYVFFCYHICDEIKLCVCVCVCDVVTSNPLRQLQTGCAASMAFMTHRGPRYDSWTGGPVPD